jgi:aspartyl-tRNA(Asn)/glutamyl-tRNA(Gln) amidotransferase subunit A
MSTDISQLSAIALIYHYRNRSLSPVEVIKATLDRIAQYEKQVNAFVLVDEERAIASARASEARWSQGEPLGAVDGIPATIKDLLLTKGWPTRRGSKAKNHIYMQQRCILFLGNRLAVLTLICIILLHIDRLTVF